MVLYFAIHQKEGPPSKRERIYFEAAGHCRRHIYQIEEGGMLLERYRHLLDEIRINAFNALGGYLSSDVATSGEPTRPSVVHWKWLSLDTLPANVKGEERERRLKLALVEGRSQWRELMKQALSATGSVQAFLDHKKRCT
jgi:hypothetical protein